MPDSDQQFIFPQARILLFARAPRLGQVKTRLIPALGAQGALDVHLRLLQRQLKVLQGNPLCPAQLWLDQDSEHSILQAFSGEKHLQSGRDLGERMWAAAREVLETNTPVVIIGSDCPELDRAYLQEALQRLSDPATDIVIGPALDGGYVLIGMKRADLQIFTGIDWGSEQVLQQTLARLKTLDLSWQLLEALCDIDTQDDLAHLL